MGSFLWSHEKNAQLLADRGLCFEAVVAAIEAGDLLDVLEHAQLRHPAQQLALQGAGHTANSAPEALDSWGPRVGRPVTLV
jgi:hypothetical protein